MPTEVTEDPSVRSPTVVPCPGPTGKGRQRRHPAPETSAAAAEPAGVSRLYTVAMMADVLGAPQAAVRHWLRVGLLEPSRRSGSLVWFEFSQLVVARRLVRLMESGLSLGDIDRQLAGLAPGGAAEAAHSAERIVVDGRRLSIHRGDSLLGAGGQLQFDFYTHGLHSIHDGAAGSVRPFVTPIPFPVQRSTLDDPPLHRDDGSVAEMLDLAAELESQAAFAEAAEALRAVLQAAGPTPQVMFMLAELLYRAGDLAAARERYYATIELDADHVEARCSLGCVLAELGEHELAMAALDGVLRQEPTYADAHWHLAGLLRDVGREDDCRLHLRMFLRLAPDSPWATMARQRLLHGGQETD